MNGKDPQAFGMVLAMLVGPGGKPLKDGSAKGQLYASAEQICVVRPSTGAELAGRVFTALLLGSIVLVLVNVFTWKSAWALWAAVAAQAIYWLALPARRRALEPEPLGAEALEARRREGRVVIQVPAGAVLRAVPPEPPRPGGFRKPARFELADGALEMYLSQEQFDGVARVIGRG